MLDNQTFLITGIADENSLAMITAEKILANNGKVICTGLGVTPFHKNLSEKAESFLLKNYEDFENACKKVLGNDVVREQIYLHKYAKFYQCLQHHQYPNLQK